MEFCKSLLYNGNRECIIPQRSSGIDLNGPTSGTNKHYSKKKNMMHVTGSASFAVYHLCNLACRHFDSERRGVAGKLQKLSTKVTSLWFKGYNHVWK